MQIQTTVFKKLNVALFAGAAAAFLAAPAAHAIVVSPVLATPITITNSIDGIYLNVITGVSGASAAAVPGWDINPYNNGAGFTLYGSAAPGGILATGTAGTSAIATLLTFGAAISPTPALGFYNQFQTLGTLFQATTGTAYVGFKFLNETTSVYNYGWLQLSLTAATGFPASVVRYGYENTGLGINAGQITSVPEVSTFAMFGMGLAAAGLAAARRRRSA